MFLSGRRGERSSHHSAARLPAQFGASGARAAGAASSDDARPNFNFLNMILALVILYILFTVSIELLNFTILLMFGSSRLAREANLEVPRDPSPPALSPKVQQQVEKVLALLVDYGVALVARIRRTRDQIRSTERSNRKLLEVGSGVCPLSICGFSNFIPN